MAVACEGGEQSGALALARIPAAVNHHPKQFIVLTCDPFGFLPLISKLTPDQVMFHCIAGFTSKGPGTEMGVAEPQATFSACVGAPFRMWHPYVYAEMLAAELDKTNCPAYLVDAGWAGGPYGTGKRMSLEYTRQPIDATHDGTRFANASQSRFCMEGRNSTRVLVVYWQMLTVPGADDCDLLVLMVAMPRS